MNLPPLNELEIAERERIVRELNRREHRRRNGMVMLRRVSEALRISRDTLYRKIKGYVITSEDLINGKFPAGITRGVAVLCSLCFLLFNSGCRSTPGEIKYRIPQFDYEQSSPSSSSSLSSSPSLAAAPARLWSAQWSPWNPDPLPAVIFVQWSSNASGPWQLAGTFPVETSSGNLTTPWSDENYFRTGYRITQ